MLSPPPLPVPLLPVNLQHQESEHLYHGLGIRPEGGLQTAVPRNVL